MGDTYNVIAKAGKVTCKYLPSRRQWSVWVNGNFISDHYSQDSAKAAFDNIVRAEQEVPR